MINLPKRRSLQLLGGAGIVGAAGLLLPRSARATQTSYAAICTTTTPASAGGIASASSQWSGTYPAAAINNGERIGQPSQQKIWKDTTADAYPDWVQIDFNNRKKINRIVVYTVQDGPTYSEPTDTMTFAQFGILDFNVQYWNGGSWITVGSVTGNNLVKRTFNITPVVTTKIRVNITNAHTLSRVVEVEAWTVPPNNTTPSYNCALAAPPPLVSGHNCTYPTVNKATAAKQIAAANAAALRSQYIAAGGLSPQDTSFAIVTKNAGATDPSQYSSYAGPLIGVHMLPGYDSEHARMQIESGGSGSVDWNTLIAGSLATLAGFGADELFALGLLGASLPELGVGAVAFGSAWIGTWIYNEVITPEVATDQLPDLTPQPMDPDAPWAWVDPISSIGGGGGVWGGGGDPINEQV